MLLARAIGYGVTTIRHPSLTGARLLLTQPLKSLTREPVLAVDRLHARPGDLVLITSDGRSAREMLNDDTSPVRWTVIGLVDDESALLLGESKAKRSAGRPKS